jgi:uncharacterized membrane protein YraQ (UPF0718 family)
MTGCCPSESQDKKGFKPDLIMHGSLAIIVPVILLHLLNIPLPFIHELGKELLELFATMWWGIALGLLTVGLMNKIPREYFSTIMGRGDSVGDIFKAAVAGVVLDLCNHGILVISGKLYERGLSAAQVMTFLIASPWNSLTLTFILISLIGWKWTLVFTLASMLIAFISGLIYLALIKKGILPSNPNTAGIDENFDIKADFKSRMKAFRPTRKWAGEIMHDGWKDGQMIIRWILFGTLIAAAMSAFIPEHIFEGYFGPTAIGLGLTLIAATIIEVCSEGSAPIATEIMNSGGAPGNGFAFLMAGVATDYTEIMVVREFTKSWPIALSLPLITVPQIIVLGVIMNMAG